MTIEEINAAVAKFPDPDPKAGVLSDANKPAMNEAIAALHKGGKPAFEAVVNMLVDRDPAADSKARHAIHALVHHLWTVKDDATRAALTQAMTAALGGDKPKEVQAFLLAQIQLSGDKAAAPGIAKVLSDAELCDPACAALLAIREGAATPLREALPKATGRVRLAIVQSLGVLKDAAAAPLLRPIVKDEDRDTRIAACWALASIGDAESSDALIAAAQTQGWERTQGVKNCLILAENLAATNRKAQAARIYRHLHDTRTEPKEKYVRDAALRGLEAIGMKLGETVS